MARLGASVGRGGTNRRDDTMVVQNLLNDHVGSLVPLRALTVDGIVGPNTIRAIEAFQRRVVGMTSPDGRVDPGGRTLAALGQRDNSGQRFHYPAGPQAPLANIARPYIGATEAPRNRMGTDSRMREIFEADSHFKDGDTDGYPWCCSFVSMCVQKLIQTNGVYGHVRPPRTASVTNFRTRWAPSQSCLVFRPNDPNHKPHKGDVVVFTFSHIGVVDEVGANMVLTIEGNTNEAGSREGTIVRRKDRAFPVIRCFIRLPIPVAYDVSELMCVA